MNKVVSTVSSLAIASSLLMAGGDIAPVEPIVAEVVVDDSWNYTASLYLWAAAIGGRTVSGDEVNFSFSDIVDNLDFGYMGNFGAKKGKWTFETDVLYLKVSGELDAPLPIIQRLKLTDWIVTPSAAYNVVKSDQWNINLLAGARYLYMKPKITLPISSVSSSDTSWNGIVGVKGDYTLNEKWFMPFTFDVGSGDADITYQALAGIGYKYENFDLIVGYRYLKWEFDGDLAGFTDLDLSGPIIGAKFRF